MGDDLDGKAIAFGITRGLGSDFAAFRRAGHQPSITAVVAGEQPAQQDYLNNMTKTGRRLGVRVNVRSLDRDVSEQQIIDVILELNEDPTVHGIQVQLPFPRQIEDDAKYRIIDTIARVKDIEGLSAYNLASLARGQPGYLPCTPQGILRLLDAYKIPIVGEDITVISNSDIVGKPLNILLSSNPHNNTVTTCNVKTKSLEKCTKDADIIITATGVPNLIKADMVKPGCVVIDAGYTKIDGRTVGDVDYKPVKAKASCITPVPGGVGPMTMAMLMENLRNAVRAYVSQHQVQR